MKLPLLGLVLVLLSLVGSPTRAEKGPVCPKTDSLSRASFPEGFMFGTATAAFQVEGAVNESCRGPSMWDIYTKQFPERVNNHNADVAVDFFHRYKEDIQLMKSLNTDSFRLSLSWPRIFPHGRMIKGISYAGVQFYHDLIDELLKNVTVFHWDTPADLEDEYGGFLSQRIVPDFVEFANFTFHEYGDKVKNWVTFNEPWVFSRAGYDIGKKAPGRCSPYVKDSCHDGRSGHEPYVVSHNLLLGHADAVEAFRKCEKCKGGKIGIAHSPAWFEPEDVEGGENTVNRVLDFIMGWHLDPTTFGDYPQTMKDAVGSRLPKFTNAQKRKLKGSADFVGINYYFSFFAKQNDKPDPRTPTWAQDARADFQPKTVDGSIKIGSQPSTAKMSVYAAGLRKLLKYIKERYGNPEIIITENGYGEDLGDKDDDHNVALNDHNRKYYLQRHLLTLNQAICEDKVNVTGYFLWSLLDNFEWQDGYTARFGIYYIDFKNNLTRMEKESARWYRQFLKPGFEGMSKSKLRMKLNEEL